MSKEKNPTLVIAGYKGKVKELQGKINLYKIEVANLNKRLIATVSRNKANNFSLSILENMNIREFIRYRWQKWKDRKNDG